MELRQLEYLVAVADDASFTRAAARLHVAQPGISAQIKKLETELGETLLDRSGRRVVPTPVGRSVLGHARAALAAVDRVRAAVAEHAGLLTGSVPVGVIGSGVPPELPDLLASFARAHPAVELTLTEGPGGDRLAALLDGRSDLAVVALVGEPPPGVASTVLRDEPVVVGVAADDPWAGRAGVPLAEVARRPLIALSEGTGLRAGLDAAFARAGLAPRVAYQAATPLVLGELAARGLGVALVPASVVPHVAGLAAVPLVEPQVRGRVDLAWPAARPLGPASRALLAHLRAGLAGPAREGGPRR